MALLKTASAQSGNQAMRFLNQSSLELPETFEASDISSVRARFQMLTPRDWTTAEIGARQGLRTAKSTFQFDINQFQQTGTNDPERIKNWLAKMADKYQLWLDDIHNWSLSSR